MRNSFRAPAARFRDRAFPPRHAAGITSVGVVGLLFFLAAAGCAPGASRAQIDAARQTRAQKLIDSGNEAYKVGDYRLAARRYAAAAVVKKNDPAAYFGMGMALSKLGRDEEARAAYARARELARTQAVLEGPTTRKSGSEAETIRADR